MSGDTILHRLEHVDSATLLALHQSNPARYPALFESAGALSNYDILFALPQERLTATSSSAARFLDELDRRWRAQQISATMSDLPFTGGWLLFFAYDLAQYIEPK